MLDQQDGDVALVADAADQLAEPVDFVVVEAAGRLVEQQELRPRRQRARKLDALLQAERKVGDAAMRDVGEIEELDQLPGDVGERRPPRARVQGSFSALVKKSLRPSGWLPTRTLSSTDMVRNSARFWNVRPMPISAMRCGGRSRMLRPSNRMSPEFGV